MKTVVHIARAHNSLSVVLDAVELLDAKLECEVTCAPDVKTSHGDAYAEGLIRILCLDGIRIARRRLSIANGLRVTIFDIKGTVDKDCEVGVCHATSLGVARALAKDESSLATVVLDWTIVE